MRKLRQLHRPGCFVGVRQAREGSTGCGIQLFRGLGKLEKSDFLLTCEACTAPYIAAVHFKQSIGLELSTGAGSSVIWYPQMDTFNHESSPFVQNYGQTERAPFWLTVRQSAVYYNYSKFCVSSSSSSSFIVCFPCYARLDVFPQSSSSKSFSPILHACIAFRKLPISV